MKRTQIERYPLTLGLKGHLSQRRTLVLLLLYNRGPQRLREPMVVESTCPKYALEQQQGLPVQPAPECRMDRMDAAASASASQTRSIITADAYVEFLEEMVSEQALARPLVLALLEEITTATLTSRSLSPPLDFQLRLFGSCAFEPQPGGYSLPSSDFDIVCELGLAAHTVGFSPTEFLQLVLEKLRAHVRCTNVSGNGIQWKSTIVFQLAAVKVDFTVCFGPAHN